jgi:hypothetical protein
VFPALFLTGCLLLLLASPARANAIQEQILNAGINLGWAEATLELRGDEDPADAQFIAEALTRAAQHVEAAANSFLEPYQTERSRRGTDQRVLDLIDSYFEQAPRLSIRQKAARVQQIWSTYRQSFQTIWDSEQGYQYYPNCDLFMLDVGYHFGRAHIAAGVGGNLARTYQQGANGGMRQAMEGGLEVAVDGYDYGPRTNTPKACCCFGVEASWRELPVFQWNSPFELYSANLPVLQRIALDAGVVPVLCTCGGEPVGTGPSPTPTPSPSPRPSPSPEIQGCLSAVGSWQWFNGIVVVVSGDGRFSSPAGHGGTWQCESDDTIVLTWDEGWRDTLTLSPDGTSMSGPNLDGFIVSATRISPDAAIAPGTCGDEGMTALYTLIDPPPYAGRSTICQGPSGDIWIQVGGMHKVLGITEGTYDPETGCSYDSSVVTESATYGGALCGP